MKILFVGPLPEPVTGQAVCFKKIVDQYSINDRIVVDTFKYRNKVLSTLYVYIKLIQILLLDSKNVACIYMTCSRSLLGFIKDVPVFLMGKLLKLRVINHLHGADFNAFVESFPAKSFLLWLYKGSETIVLLDSMREQFSSFPNMKLWTVPNFYDNSFDSYQHTGIKNKGQILFLSNLMKSKGIIEFIESADRILSNEKLSIVIAGSFMGDKHMTEQSIRSLIEPKLKRLSTKYEKRFSYKGFVSGDAKIRLYAESDIFILPSYTEGFPISIIEAMRMGCTIHSTDVDYIPNIVCDQNGTIIPLNDLKNIHIYIETEVNDQKQMRLKQKHNTDYALNNYSESKYLNSLQEIIELK